ncbi:MAG: Hpt domain-containing protein [Clostridiales bacterium]|nr:Hpt domain-containing protein [Clostridiales bacterium]
MLTIDALKSFGANTDDALARCMGNEAFYFRLIGKVLEDKNFNLLEESILAKDFDKAFEAAHTLKGVLGNLSLTPIYDPVCEITELLRTKSDVDYAPYISSIADKKAELLELMK